jgi:serine/threonine protein kinase
VVSENGKRNPVFRDTGISFSLCISDIKTENILLAPRAGTFPRLVIADFGHAIETGDDQIYLQVRGTMSNLCPEEVMVLLGRCQAGYDPKMADVWSLASELRTGDFAITKRNVP